METKKLTRSVRNGFLAGVVGGLAGAAVKLAAEYFFPPRIQGQTPPPVALAQQVTGRGLDRGEERLAIQSTHWIFGALAGGVYGIVVEFEPSMTAWRGAAFGVTLNRITHESLLPKLGLAARPNDQPTQERISEWVTHAAYGVATESVRRVVRRSL